MKERLENSAFSTLDMITNFDHDLTLEDFQQKFDTEEACMEALFQARWPHGFRCPRCSCAHMTVITTRRLPLYECLNCRRQTSVQAGTVMENSKTDLRKWFTAMFLVSRKQGDLNAVKLQSIIQVTYKTAWLMLSKIRAAISRADEKTRLSGHVRINSAAYGRVIHAMARRHPQEHPLLIGAEIDQQGNPKAIKIKQMLDEFLNGRSVNRLGIHSFIQEHVDAQLEAVFQHTVINRATQSKRTIAKMKIVSPNRIECDVKRFSRNKCMKLKAIAKSAGTWLNDTFHGIGRKHLQKYLDEFCFRWNQSKSQTPIFVALLQICAAAPAPTYDELVNTVIEVCAA